MVAHEKDGLGECQGKSYLQRIGGSSLPIALSDDAAHPSFPLVSKQTLRDRTNTDTSDSGCVTSDTVGRGDTVSSPGYSNQPLRSPLQAAGPSLRPVHVRNSVASFARDEHSSPPPVCDSVTTIASGLPAPSPSVDLVAWNNGVPLGPIPDLLATTPNFQLETKEEIITRHVYWRTVANQLFVERGNAMYQKQALEVHLTRESIHAPISFAVNSYFIVATELGEEYNVQKHRAEKAAELIRGAFPSVRIVR